MDKKWTIGLGLFGRFGGKRRRSDDERNARNITQAQKK